MAQNIIFEDDYQNTVNFSNILPGEVFVYGGNKCICLDNNNPNYVVIGENNGTVGKLEDTDQVIIPDSVLIKTE